MTRPKNPLKMIFRQRMYFLLEVLIVFIGILIFMLIPVYLIPLLIDVNSVLYEPVVYSVRAIVLILGVTIFLYFANFIMESQKRKIILEEDISPSKSFLKLFNITKSNFKYQFLYGILILFLIFIPLDFFTYLLIPEMLYYSVEALSPNAEFSLNSYLLENYVIFLFSVIIIQIFVAIYEESLTRGFLTNRGSEYVQKMSAVIISSFFFGLGHFGYILNPSSNIPVSFLFIWFLQTFLVGIILSMITLRRRWLFPVILAHAGNNIISAHAIWNFINGISFNVMTIVYIPLLIVSIILFVWQFSRIKESLSIGFKEFKEYFKNDQSIGEDTIEKFARIMLDFLVGLIIFLIGIIIL
jgi:membrane protease YdiL (CAAX protease family)